MSAFAFFDVDGTLINTRSLIGFLDHLRPLVATDRFESYWKELQRKVWERVPREQLNRFYFSVFQGLPQPRVQALGRAWFVAAAKDASFFNQEGLSMLREQQRCGVHVCLVTGSFRELMVPLASSLQVQQVLCTEPEVVQGRFTGRLVGDPCIGMRKVSIVEQFAARHGVDLQRCVAVGDDESDRPLLQRVGQGVLLTPQPAYAAEMERVLGSAPAGAWHG